MDWTFDMTAEGRQMNGGHCLRASTIDELFSTLSPVIKMAAELFQQDRLRT